MPLPTPVLVVLLVVGMVALFFGGTIVRTRRLARTGDANRFAGRYLIALMCATVLFAALLFVVFLT